MVELKKVHRLKKELDSLRPISKENELRIMQKFRLDWNYNSNHLEGNTLTFGETKALLLHNITAQGKPLKDHIEITGHDEAIKWIEDIVKQDRPLTENFIRELHELLLKEPYEVDAITPEGKPTKKMIQVGQYKSTSNHVKTQTGEIFRFASVEETPAMMTHLLDWYKNELKNEELDPIIFASEFHYRFIRIHPFDDGNGRIARILMNFIFMQFAYPPVVIKSEDKQNYFLALQQADGDNLPAFIQYVANQLVHSLELMLLGANGKSIEDVDDLDKELKLLETQLKSITKPADIIRRSREGILSVFNGSLKSLSKHYWDKAKQLDQYYVSSAPHILIDKAYISNKNTKELSLFDSAAIDVEMFENVIGRIEFDYKYVTFNQIGFRPNNYSSRISVSFEATTYKVYSGADEYSDSELKYELLYSEQLTQDQIRKLVTFEIMKHMTLIKQMIEKDI